MTAYNETCAAIGNDFWNHRLFLLHADAKYIDVMERTLYNGLLSGVSLDGKAFFYPNPLESAGQHARSPWFGVACCPGNMTRFLASVPGYVYAKSGDDDLREPVRGGHGRHPPRQRPRRSRSRQQTRYPWDGNVTLTVTPDRTADFTIDVRIPGWARNQPVPSDLYRFLDAVADPVVLKVNGAPVPLALDKGYVALRRTWRAGDVDQPRAPDAGSPRRGARPVEADRSRVALQRGPIVYAAEWPDSPNRRVRNLLLPDASALSAEFRPKLLERRHRDHGHRLRPAPSTPPAPVDADRAAVHRDPVLRVGQPRPRRDARLDPARRIRRPPHAVADGGHDEHGVGVGQEPPQPEDDQRWRGPALLDRPGVLLRLVADQGHDRVGRVHVPEARDGVRSRGVLVRRHRIRARSACPRRGASCTATATPGSRSSRAARTASSGTATIASPSRR